jgi:sugar/nucleoside kinase (ribokinase family)
VVVKKGAAGCRVLRGRDERVDVPGLTVTVRDTTAAGDCFDAGYLLAYLKGWPPVDCARLANCMGAAAVQKLGGGRNVPALQEVRRMISQMGGGIEI